MGVKKFFRGGTSADEHEAASLGITSVYCTNADYSDLVSPMKGPSVGAASGTSSAKATGQGKAGWPAGIRKRQPKKKERGSSGAESSGTPTSDSPKSDIADVPAAQDAADVDVSTANIGRSVKFADEGSVGAPLHTTKLIDSASSTNNGAGIAGRRARAKSVQPSPGRGYIGFPPTTVAEAEQYWRRVLVMLLSPETQEFEIVAIYYDVRERTGLSNVLHQIPKVATSKCFSGKARSRMHYRGLTRARNASRSDKSSGRGSAEPGEELISVLSLADYDIQPDEMLVAIPKEIEGKVIAPMAASLLADGRVQKLVNRIVRSNQVPPPPTLYGRIRRGVARSKRRLNRRLRNGGIGIKLMAIIIVVIMLLMWVHMWTHIFTPAYLPPEVHELDAGFGRAIEAFWE
mmetsp:Transcript_29800/g.69936  ORF Transcript_29800/g.69936 Transcript_29800/m.69936 type:complete len:403 (-) Transcript_29800:2110-3318(-)